VYFLVRTSHPLTGKELGEVEAAVVTALPPASVRVERLEAVMREQTAPLRAVQAMCAMLFALGAGLGAIGIRASMRLSVATRLREMGIRAALGASRGRLVASVLEESAIAGGVAAALGIAIGVLASHALATVIVGVGRAQTVWQVAIGLAVPALVVAASAVSAFRATRVEPSVLLSDWRGQI
jgi:ABC-type lipoprotein release transport system permease subunit